jgi:GT2 family glycosyltransferase
MKESLVAVALLNYNGWRYTLECVESLGHLDYPRWYAVVVDNGSTDDSEERIRAWARGEVKVESAYVRKPGWGKPVQLAEYEGEPPEEQVMEGEAGAKLVLIRLSENRGFAAGNNFAIRYALRRGLEWT